MVVTFFFQTSFQIIVTTCANGDQIFGLKAVSELSQVWWYETAQLAIEVIDLK